MCIGLENQDSGYRGPRTGDWKGPKGALGI